MPVIRWLFDELSRIFNRVAMKVVSVECVDEAALKRFHGVDRLAAQDHRNRPFKTHQPRQALGAAAAGDEAKGNFR